MPKADDVADSKAAQTKEANNRQRNANIGKVDDGRDLAAQALDVPADNAGPDDDVTPAPRRTESPEDRSQERRPHRAPSDDARSQIIKGFREHRKVQAEQGEEGAEIEGYAQDGMPPELQQLRDDEPVDIVDAAAEPVEPVADPKKHSLKIRGETREYTTDEIIAAAQKALAGDDYLDEAKAKARKITDDVDEILNAARSKVNSQPSSGKHPAGENGEVRAEDNPDLAAGEHPADKRLVEEITYGDPEVAEKRLTSTIDTAAEKAARKVLSENRMTDEVARSQRIFTSFLDENADLAQDPYARSVMTQAIFDLQVEDLKAIGVPDDKLPKTMADLDSWHTWYRSQDAKVRGVKEILTEAKNKYVAWKGTPAPATDTTKRGQPRVELSPERTQRRESISPQPTRSAAPARARAAPAPQQTDRSAIVERMRQSRGQPTLEVPVPRGR